MKSESSRRHKKIVKDAIKVNEMKFFPTTIEEKLETNENDHSELQQIGNTETNKRDIYN